MASAGEPRISSPPWASSLSPCAAKIPHPAVWKASCQGPAEVSVLRQLTGAGALQTQRTVCLSSPSPGQCCYWGKGGHDTDPAPGSGRPFLAGLPQEDLRDAPFTPAGETVSFLSTGGMSTQGTSRAINSHGGSTTPGEACSATSSVWPWASHLASLSLSSLICEMGMQDQLSHRGAEGPVGQGF